MMPSCPEYTVNVTADISAPTAYKCMTTAEYQSYLAEHQQAQHGADVFAAWFMGVFVLAIAAMILYGVWQVRSKR